MSYGATDWFSFANATWRCVAGSKSISQSNAVARNEVGDILNDTAYGEDRTYTSEYEMVADTGSTGLSATCKLGAFKLVDTNQKTLITSLALSTSNTAYPRLTITAMTTGDSTADRVYDPTELDTIALGFGADIIGIVPDTTTSSVVINSDITFATERATILNGSGTLVNSQVFGAKYSANNTLNCVTGTPTAVAASGWVTDNSGASTQNTDYATATISVHKAVAADT